MMFNGESINDPATVNLNQNEKGDAEKEPAVGKNQGIQKAENQGGEGENDDTCPGKVNVCRKGKEDKGENKEFLHALNPESGGVIQKEKQNKAC